MLQQTQVARVVEFYPRFLQRYPTLEDLASAPAHEVRESWEGLGYYARARNLHAAVRRIAAESGGGGARAPAGARGAPARAAATAGAAAGAGLPAAAPR